MKKYSSAVLALILASSCMTASAVTQEISKKKPMSVMETRQWRLSISTPLPETPMQ